MITFLFAAALAAPTVAQDTPPAPLGGMMMRADSDGDGVVTRAEHLAQAGERFDRLDANRDGKLTEDETAGMGQRMRGMRGMRRGATPAVPAPAQ